MVETKEAPGEIDVSSLSTEQKQKLTQALAEATQIKEQKKDLTEVTEQLVNVVKEFSGIVQTKAVEEQAEMEAEKFEKLSKEKVVETFKSLPANDPNREVIKSELAKEFGIHNTDLVLNGTTLTKAISRPVYKGTKNGEELIDMQKAWDYAYQYTYLLKGIRGSANEKDTIDPTVLKRAIRELSEAGLPGADMLLKGVNEAMDTQTATEGLEWIPTNFSSRMHEDVWLALRLAPLFRRYTMTSKSYTVPIRTARSRGYRVAESTAYNDFFTNKYTAHNLETGNVTFTAEKLGTLTFVSAELEQDSIIDVMSIVREDIQYGLADAIDDAILNGDADATLDSTLWSGTADARGAWDGIRDSINAGAKVDGATFNLEVMRNVRKSLGKYGVDPNMLYWVVSPQTFVRMLSFPEVITVDKYGPNATVKTGELAQIDGISIIVSPSVYTNLNNNGVYDGVTTDKTAAVLVHKLGFAIGDRRAVRINTDYSLLSDQNAILTSTRMDFQKMFPAAENVAGLLHRLTL